MVTADFAQSGGIFENAEVTYRGRRRGPGGPAAAGRRTGSTSTCGSRTGPACPTDTAAVVENRSAVGEQYVDLQPRRQGGPFLADGDRIRAEETRSPLPTEVLLLNLNRLVQSVDKRDLVVVIDELGQGVRGRRDGTCSGCWTPATP